MKLTKHIGIDADTSARIALLMPLLEGTEDCLIVYLDRLPALLKDSLFHVLNSDEGQRETDLSKALSTRLYSDSGTSILQTLHTSGYITKAPISKVLMTPSPAYKIPLRDVLVASGLMKEAIDGTNQSFNPHQHNADAAVHGEAVGTARNLLIEAELLEQAAKDKRDKAYRLAPALRPSVAVEPTASPEANLAIEVAMDASGEG